MHLFASVFPSIKHFIKPHAWNSAKGKANEKSRGGKDLSRVFWLRGNNEYSEWSTPNDAYSNTPGCTSPKSSRLRANGTEERDLSAAINPEAGKFYNITLDKDK